MTRLEPPTPTERRLVRRLALVEHLLKRVACPDCGGHGSPPPMRAICELCGGTGGTAFAERARCAKVLRNWAKVWDEKEDTYEYSSVDFGEELERLAAAIEREP